VKKNLPAVTVLIGLSINGFSRFGVVHNPFSFENVAESVTYFGSGEHGAFRVPFNIKMTSEETLQREIKYLQPFNHEEEPAEDFTIRVAASLQHFSETMKSIIEQLKPVEIVRLGGAGNKCNNLAIGVVDCYCHPSPGLKFWDLCAPESIVKGMGGYATDLALNRLTYHVGADPNIKGLILAKNPPLHRTI
jgi:3'-phosphoadenosine 5'-phosphosulfate (PAPS) 3'-phosphatase